jgi:hypothetical protein
MYKNAISDEFVKGRIHQVFGVSSDISDLYDVLAAFFTAKHQKQNIKHKTQNTLVKRSLF